MSVVLQNVIFSKTNNNKVSLKTNKKNKNVKKKRTKKQ